VPQVMNYTQNYRKKYIFLIQVWSRLYWWGILIPFSECWGKHYQPSRA
jgi:hypothetical protein